MSTADLQRFCASEDDPWPHLRQPWSHGERTYATNGHILVYVPRIAEIPENAKAPDTTRLLENATSGEWVLVPETAMPQDVPCEWCEGSGRYPLDRRHECGECDGMKTQPDTRSHTKINSIAFANRFLALIQGWEIAPTSTTLPAPIRRGDAGGLLMPMRI